MRYSWPNFYGKNQYDIRPIIGWLLKIILVLAPAVSAKPISYIINTQNSYVHIITDKSGFLKTLGHRHLISFKPVKGQVCYRPSSTSFATLEFAPSTFLVDEAKTLKNYPQLASQRITDETRQGTRQNMLSEGLLYAEKYPTIDVTVDLLDMDQEQAQLRMQWHALGRPIAIEVTSTLSIEAQELTVSAEFQSSAPQLGFPVFSVLNGLLNVGESLHFMIYIEAVKKQYHNNSCVNNNH